jgi:hypothetical protein
MLPPHLFSKIAVNNEPSGSESGSESASNSKNDSDCDSDPDSDADTEHLDQRSFSCAWVRPGRMQDYSENRGLRRVRSLARKQSLRTPLQRNGSAIQRRQQAAALQMFMRITNGSKQSEYIRLGAPNETSSARIELAQRDQRGY